MKKIIFIAIMTFSMASVKSQTKYSVKGTTANANEASHAVLSYPPDQGTSYKADTIAIVKNQFEFKGIVGRPQLAELNLIFPVSTTPKQSNENDPDTNMKNVGLFYLDGAIEVSFSKDGTASYKGGDKEQKAWTDYEQLLKLKTKELNGKQPEMAFFEMVIGDFIKEHPDSYVSVDLLDLFTMAAINPSIVGPMYNALSERMKKTPKVLSWKDKLETAIKQVSGSVEAKNFTMNDKDGNQVTLSSYKGQYVLLDFWASWCAPCRAENPNVLAAYQEFKDKKFTILAVSLDDQREAWLKAIKEDKLPWKQLSDLKGGENEAAQLYDVSIIPDNFLIDPNGKIIARGLRGKALRDKLNELIK